MMAVARSALVALALAACGGGSEAETACTDGQDDDMDGDTDCLDIDCAEEPFCMDPLPEVCTGGLDEDQDQFADCDDESCWDDPTCWQLDDPTDLPGPNGDPAVDIDKFRVTLSGGVATFFATFDGNWPPSMDNYSYFVLFEIDNDGNTPQASVTLQRHDGVPSEVLFGLGTTQVLTRQGAQGIWVRMTGLPVAGVKYYVESGIQKTNPGTRVTDTVVSAPAPLP